MFVPVWLIFMSTGLLMAVFTLVWSVKTRQFDDQQRARYLPLAGLSAEELARQPIVRRSASLYAYGLIILIGLLSVALTMHVLLKTVFAH
jgi:cbb3-type cytochrome oxidase maturation protein